ncbi:MAG: diacylglycerol kinase family protein [Candidatus Sericytochromatia bacterium]|nr:diacylglycerol kinase family protein [Candidatus Sericytochromatia bacterium]
MRFKAENLLASFRFAFAGIYFCLRTERNMRIHVAAGVLAMALGAWLRIPFFHLALIAVVSSLVVTMEMLNTAIENAVDLFTHRKHPLAKIAKDVAAAAVLVSAANALLVGLLLLGPPLFEVIQVKQNARVMGPVSTLASGRFR